MLAVADELMPPGFEPVTRLVAAALSPPGFEPVICCFAATLLPTGFERLRLAVSERSALMDVGSGDTISSSVDCC